MKKILSLLLILAYACPSFYAEKEDSRWVKPYLIEYQGSSREGVIFLCEPLEY